MRPWPVSGDRRRSLREPPPWNFDKGASNEPLTVSAFALAAYIADRFGKVMGRAEVKKRLPGILDNPPRGRDEFSMASADGDRRTLSCAFPRIRRRGPPWPESYQNDG